MPATMMALKWYHCIRAASRDDNTFIGIFFFLICDSESRAFVLSFFFFGVFFWLGDESEDRTKTILYNKHVAVFVLLYFYS